MRVFITGGTGLIGTPLIRRLIARGDQPVVLTRRASSLKDRPDYRGAEVIQGDPSISGAWELAVDGCDAVINLVGHNIFAQRWSPDVRRKIRNSRVDSTENLVSAVRKASHRPEVFVQSSAIGYYGASGDEELTEESPPGSDFMAEVCREWEAASHPVAEQGLRLAIIRTGVVLAKGTGALGVMTPIFKMGGASPVGSGSNPLKPATGAQWLSWIHLDDIVSIFLMALDHQGAEGPINGTAPNPVRNAEFSKALARVVRRPFLPIGPPDALLRLLLGDVAQVITKGQRVLPSKAQELGVRFAYPELTEALRDLLGPKRPTAEPKPAAAS